MKWYDKTAAIGMILGGATFLGSLIYQSPMSKEECYTIPPRRTPQIQAREKRMENSAPLMISGLTTLSLFGIPRAIYAEVQARREEIRRVVESVEEIKEIHQRGNEILGANLQTGELI